MTLSDALSSLVSGGLLTLLAGGARELLRLWGYRMELRAQADRDRLLAEHPEAAAALAKDPISKPPTLGPLAVMLALAGTTGAAAGPVVAPHVATFAAAECRKNSDCGSGCTCSGGQCKCAAIDRRPPPKPEPRSASATASYRDYAGDPFWGPTEAIETMPALDRQ